MRLLRRNLKTVYWKNYVGKTEITDDYGYYTGESNIAYTDFLEAKMNVSASRGLASEEMFGISTNYSKVLMTDDINCSMDEHSILWIDAPTTGPYNYVVVQVAKSLNSIAYAVREVNVSESPNQSW